MMIHRSPIQICFESLYTRTGKLPFQGYQRSTYESTPLTSAVVSQMSGCLEEEILAYYYKALLSYAESIPAICLGHYSWATVKLYYSTFYALRASLACNDYVFLRGGELRNFLYYVQLKSGEKLTKAGSSDHKSTIELQQKKFSNEWLLSQKITDGDEDLFSYDWLIKRREDVNYKDILFRDPIPSEMWENIRFDVESHGISAIINQLINDSGTMCFQQEYAVLGIPTKRIFFTSEDLHNKGIYLNDNEKKDFLKTTISGIDTGIWDSLLRV